MTTRIIQGAAQDECHNCDEAMHEDDELQGTGCFCPCHDADAAPLLAGAP